MGARPVSKFDEDQPRADDGKWVGGGEGSSSPASSSGHAQARARLEALPTFTPSHGPSTPSVDTNDVFAQKRELIIIGMRPADEKKFVPAQVSLSSIVPTQEGIPKAGLAAYIGAPPSDKPRVYSMDGDTSKLYVFAGHTRLGASILRGETTASVHLYNFDRSTSKWTKPVKKAAVQAVEVENLDRAGEDAFVRLSSRLPVFASELARLAKAAGELGEDLVVVPAVSVSSAPGPSFAEVVADLSLLEKLLAPAEAARAKKLRALMIGLGGIEKYDPDQPRDDHGKWADAGSGGAPAPLSAEEAHRAMSASAVFDHRSADLKQRMSQAAADTALAINRGSVPKAIAHLEERKRTAILSAREELRRDYGGRPDPETKAFFDRMVKEKHEEYDRAIEILRSGKGKVQKAAVYCSRCKDEIPCAHFDAGGELTETGRRANERAKARKDAAGSADAPTTGGDVSTGDLAAHGGALSPAQGTPKKKPKKTEEHPAEQPGVLPQYRELNLGTEVAVNMRDPAEKGSGTSLGLALASSSGPAARETPEPKKKPDGKHLFPADVSAPSAGAGGDEGGGGVVGTGVSMRMKSFAEDLTDRFVELLTGEELEKRRRAEMPQIPTEKLGELVTFLRDRGVSVESSVKSVAELKSSQDDLNKAKVGRIKAQGLKKLLDGPDLLVADDGNGYQILDGHHRAAAIKELDPNAKVKVLAIQASIEDAIAHAHEFPHAEVRGINDGVIKFARVVVKRAKASDLEQGEEEQRTVFGIVLEPETVDSQGDIYSEDEIRESAWKFAERYQHFGLMHRHLVPGIVLLETYLAPVDFEIVDRSGQAQKIKKGTWLLRVRVTDDSIWEAVKDGRLDGFSIGGSAVRQPLKGGKKTAA